jgi:hypothetical protein
MEGCQGVVDEHLYEEHQPSMNISGELSKHPSTSMYLAYDKWRGTIYAIKGHEMGNAMNRRNMGRNLFFVLEKRVCGYHMSRGC